MTIAVLTLFAALAALGDYLACAWHRARERRRVAFGAVIAVVIECLGWLPVWVAIEWQDVRVLIASAIGAGVGSVIGFKSGQKASEHGGGGRRSDRHLHRDARGWPDSCRARSRGSGTPLN